MTLLLKCRMHAAMFCFAFFTLPATYAQVSDSLYAVRQQRVSQNISTSDIDLQLYNLGERFPALVQVESEMGLTTIQFPLFLAVDASRVDRIHTRLSDYYNWLNLLSVDVASQSVTARFSATDISFRIAEVVSHFGYLGYEIND